MKAKVLFIGAAICFSSVSVISAQQRTRNSESGSKKYESTNRGTRSREASNKNTDEKSYQSKSSKSSVTYTNHTPKTKSSHTNHVVVQDKKSRVDRKHGNEGSYHKGHKQAHVVSKSHNYHVGTRIYSRPVHSRVVHHHGHNFYYSDGYYYKYHDRGRYYEVISAPIGGIVFELPFYAARVRIGYNLYFEADNILYRKIFTERGAPAYEIVGPSHQCCL